jgi:hypothetical protein
MFSNLNLVKFTPRGERIIGVLSARWRWIVGAVPCIHITDGLGLA